ncbi:hypothetical protein JOY42_26045 [Bacillus tropicus]|uniref:hypothetical protein n=1 Tax=Bacillus cereus group TaxID=86661 RepID=UPI0022E212F8|nr:MULTISPECIES: hypothetical protein [unclassified Bacillus cereus group]MDA1564025.1 hypothetical protein [Bacillus cereus group sp. TH243-1LC]MDA1860988.1 hypothetical protein [Bacillus cereus group sp. BY122LC]
MNQDDKKSFVKDVILWNAIFILSMCIIGMITIYVTNVVIDAKSLIEQISFASSFVSIILAIMAMIYAFFQARESSQQNIQVQHSLGKLDERIIELISIKGEFSALNSAIEEQSKWINNSVEELKHVMDDFKEAVEVSQKESDPGLKNKIEEIEKNLDKIQKSKKKADDSFYNFNFSRDPVIIEGNSVLSDYIYDAKTNKFVKKTVK